MSSPQTVTKNIVLGAGYIYFDPEDSAGALTGQKYVAETDGFSLNLSTEKTEIDSSDTPVAETLVSLVKKVTRAGTLVTKNMSDDVFEWFIQGGQSTVTQTTTPVAAEAVAAVQQGRYYQLGASTSNPTGVKNISVTSVEDSGGGTPYTVTTDYVVNAEEGRIYIVIGGGIADDTDIEVDYTPVANTRVRVASSGDGAQRGALYFRGDNTNGENREVYIPQCELGANGDLAFKDRDNAMTATFDLNILTRTGYAQVYVDGVPVST